MWEVGFLEWETDSIDETTPIVRGPRRVLARPNFFETLNEEEFIRRFRLRKASVMKVHELIKEKIKPPSERNNAIPSLNRLLIALRYYATGCFLITVGDFAGTSEASASRVVATVSAAIAALWESFITLPTGREMGEVMRGFQEIAGFPRVVGTVDCTHVKIQSPGGEDAEKYRNRKDIFSINCQTLCDHRLRIRDISAYWPGSTHDMTILNHSGLLGALERGIFGTGVILGDGGYRCRNFLLTPLLNPTTTGQIRYNDAHKTTRNTVERQYGVWKRRWNVLRAGIRLKIDKVESVIVSCAILHNLAIEMGDELPEDLDVVNDVDEDFDEPSSLDPSTQQPLRNDQRTRNEIIAYFEQL